MIEKLSKLLKHSTKFILFKDKFLQIQDRMQSLSPYSLQSEF